VVKIRFPPEWGVTKVPEAYRYLGFLDYFVLWSSLGIGLLVIAAGSFLVPYLSLTDAILVIILGSVIGSLLLALVGYVGARHGCTTMVSLRPSFGLFGSYLPSLLNVIQLVGWASFEIMIMARSANTLSASLGFGSFYFWVAFFTAVVILMALGGPIVVVRKWLEKFAVWLVYGTAIWITYYVIFVKGIDLSIKAQGGLPFWLAVDLVIAMPISWAPLVSDYNRFARDANRCFLGTFLGYTVSNTWFYLLGALLVLGFRTGDVVSAIAGIGYGWLALILILVDETDNAFADVYSASISTQNMLRRAKHWWLVLAYGVASGLLAALLPMEQYEGFLLFIGSVFVPLFGVLLVDYALRGKYGDEELFESRPGVGFRAILAWLAGVSLYLYITNFVPDIGASLPSLSLTALIYYLLKRYLG